MLKTIFIVAYSNKIEVAYQEAVALKRQEELIREEEAAWLAESEQKAKRSAAEKEKKTKKKQVWYLSLIIYLQNLFEKLGLRLAFIIFVIT